MSGSRLFVAVRFPSELQSRIAGASRRLREDNAIRPVNEAQLHLTLRFIGNVPEEQVSVIAASLESAVSRHSIFRLSLGSAGAFPSVQRARVVWLGVGDSDPMTRLQADIEAAVVDAGAPPDQRPFHAHVTLGRVRRGASLSRAPDAIASVEFEASLDVRAVSLMESFLGPGGARHREVRSFELGSLGPDAGVPRT